MIKPDPVIGAAHHFDPVGTGRGPRRLENRVPVADAGKARDHMGVTLEFAGGGLDQAVAEKEGVKSVCQEGMIG